jgi:ribosome biogenesis protein SSF1/2
VLNGFRQALGKSSDGPPLQLVSTILTKLFPAIDVKLMQVGQCRRVVLFNYKKDTNLVELRHYAVIKKPAGMTRGVQKLVRWNNRQALDLGRKADVSEFVLSGGTGAASDSEGDDAIPVDVPPGTRQALAQATNQIGIRLVELGPRLDLTLIKAEEELCGGTVLYHLYIQRPTSTASE